MSTHPLGRALDWLRAGPRRQLLAGGGAAVAVAAGLAAGVYFATSSDDEGEPPSPPAVQASATTSPTPARTPLATSAPAAPRLVFLRPLQTTYGPPTGVLSVSDLDGSNAVQVTPGDLEASFVGLFQNDGGTTVYYVAVDPSGAAYTLYSRELTTGEVNKLLAIGSALSDFAQPPSASLSTDGRYIAMVDSEGITVLNLASGERTRVLSNDVKGCRAGPISRCYSYHAPVWSPDGKLLLVTKGGYEGSVVVVAGPPMEGEIAVLPQPSAGGWSPANDAACTFFGPPGLYGPGGIYLYSAPDWESRTLLAEYEASPDPGGDYNYRSVSQCQWLDDQRIVFATAVARPRQPGEEVRYTLSLYHLAAGQATPLTEFPVHPPQTWVPPPQIFPVSGTDTIVVNDFSANRSLLLSIADGSSSPILQAGDLVVGVTAPLSLPRDVSPATPAESPCGLLAAHCEARVIGVGPDKLNVRDAPSQGAVIRQLSEGDVVCLGGSFSLADGLRWWPLAGEPTAYVAQGGPEASHRPWLEPTGREC